MAGSEDRPGDVPHGSLPDGSGGPHFFVADLEHPELSDDDRHHAERVLRVRAGDDLTVGDGDGRWRAARFADRLDVTSAIVSVPAPEVTLTIGFALVKGSKPELVVQKLTELGIDVIQPFVAERSVVLWDDSKMVRARERWATVARAAAMQSRRVRLPEVGDVASFVEVVGSAGGRGGGGVALADRDGRPPTRSDTTVLVGPEGGWSAAEVGSGLDRVQFGPQVLRAETAALTVGSVLGVLRAGLVEPVDDR